MLTNSVLKQIRMNECTKKNCWRYCGGTYKWGTRRIGQRLYTDEYLDVRVFDYKVVVNGQSIARSSIDGIRWANYCMDKFDTLYWGLNVPDWVFSKNGDIGLMIAYKNGHIMQSLSEEEVITLCRKYKENNFRAEISKYFPA